MFWTSYVRSIYVLCLRGKFKEKSLEVCIIWKVVGLLEFCIFPGYKNINMLKTFLKKNFWTLFYGWGSTASRLQSRATSRTEDEVYVLLLSSQKSLLLILLTSEEWKAALTLELPSGFEHKTPGLRISTLTTI